MPSYFIFVNARMSDQFSSNICLVRVNRIDSSGVAVNTVTVASRNKVRKATSSAGCKRSGKGGIEKNIISFQFKFTYLKSVMIYFIICSKKSFF